MPILGWNCLYFDRCFIRSPSWTRNLVIHVKISNWYRLIATCYFLLRHVDFIVQLVFKGPTTVKLGISVCWWYHVCFEIKNGAVGGDISSKERTGLTFLTLFNRDYFQIHLPQNLLFIDIDLESAIPSSFLLFLARPSMRGVNFSIDGRQDTPYDIFYGQHVMASCTLYAWDFHENNYYFPMLRFQLNF